MLTIPKTYGELNINIFENLFTSALAEIFVKHFGNFELANIEFTAMFNSRKISSLTTAIILKYGVYQDNKYVSISQEGVQMLTDSITHLYEYKWRRISNINETEYNPLKPFNIELQESAKDTLDTQKDKTTYVDNDGSYGFNSVSSVPTDKTDGESNREYKRTIDNTRDYTRIGNIGNTSFQELVEQERQVSNYKLKEVILYDISTVVCRGKYL